MKSYVDLAFPVRGNFVPLDHSYPLYGALSCTIPAIHNADWIGIHPIAARIDANGMLNLARLGTLRIRVPAERIPLLIGLAGARLDLAGHGVELGAPSVHPLIPAATLDSRLVIIRLTNGVGRPFDRAAFAERFLAEARRQLAQHDISGRIELSGRRCLTVGRQRIIGFALRVASLSVEDSIKLQILGLGGKRTMGCGIFRPARIKARALRAA